MARSPERLVVGTEAGSVVDLWRRTFGIWLDRANYNYAKILETSALRIVGTTYGGYNAREVGGTANQMGNRLIAGALSLHETGRSGIAYDGRNSVRNRRSVLVE